MILRYFIRPCHMFQLYPCVPYMVIIIQHDSRRVWYRSMETHLELLPGNKIMKTVVWIFSEENAHDFCITSSKFHNLTIPNTSS